VHYDEIYTDLETAPFDEDIPPDEGDAGAVSEAQGGMSINKHALQGKALRKALIIPFKRVVRRGSSGDDVRAIKRALWRANFLPRSLFSPVMGPIASGALKRFQKKHGIDATGHYGRPTHRALAPFFDEFAFLLYVGHVPGGTNRDKTRAAIVANLLWGYAHRGDIHYRMSRPVDGLHNKHKLPLFTDCSGFVTDCYVWERLPNPNGDGALMYTGTLSQHGQFVHSIANAEPADLVIYGHKYPYDHVAGYIGHGKVISHGSEGGPYLLPIDYRSDRNQIRSYL
jgi:hypothetical protein